MDGSKNCTDKLNESIKHYWCVLYRWWHEISWATRWIGWRTIVVSRGYIWIKKENILAYFYWGLYCLIIKRVDTHHKSRSFQIFWFRYSIKTWNYFFKSKRKKWGIRFQKVKKFWNVSIKSKWIPRIRFTIKKLIRW